MEPDFRWTRVYLGKTLLAQGKPEAALAMVQHERRRTDRLLYLPVMLEAAGRQAEADEALKAQIADWAELARTMWPRPMPIAAITISHSSGSNEPTSRGTLLLSKFGEPLLDGIADDPRFKAFLRKMKLPEWPTQAIAATGK